MYIYEVQCDPIILTLYSALILVHNIYIYNYTHKGGWIFFSCCKQQILNDVIPSPKNKTKTWECEAAAVSYKATLFPEMQDCCVFLSPVFLLLVYKFEFSQ